MPIMKKIIPIELEVIPGFIFKTAFPERLEEEKIKLKTKPAIPTKPSVFCSNPLSTCLLSPCGFKLSILSR